MLTRYSENIYTYCSNNPINYNDSEGRSCKAIDPLHDVGIGGAVIRKQHSNGAPGHNFTTDVMDLYEFRSEKSVVEKQKLSLGITVSHTTTYGNYNKRLDSPIRLVGVRNAQLNDPNKKVSYCVGVGTYGPLTFGSNVFSSTSVSSEIGIGRASIGVTTGMNIEPGALYLDCSFDATSYLSENSYERQSFSVSTNLLDPSAMIVAVCALVVISMAAPAVALAL